MQLPYIFQLIFLAIKLPENQAEIKTLSTFCPGHLDLHQKEGYSNNDIEAPLGWTEGEFFDLMEE